MLNIVIPMAGRGSRFQKVGYDKPKPLIPILGKQMIDVVIKNLRPSSKHRFIFLCLREHQEHYGIREVLQASAPGSEVIFVDSVTEGAACTVLLAESLIDTENPLMIANSDQWVDIKIDSYLDELKRRELDGIIMTMSADDPKWSYVAIDSKGLVTSVVEKQVISNEATVGIYNFRCGSDFVRAAKSMIAKNLRVNGEFYVAPVYNEIISSGKTIGIYNIGAEFEGMYGLGIPEDLERFISHPVATRAVGN